MTGPAPARALVRAAIAPLHAQPRASSPQVSQRLAGHELEVLAGDGPWSLVRGADGYEGWVHEGYIARPAAMGARQSGTSRRVSLGCVTRIPGGGRRALPLGAYLSPGEAPESGRLVEEPRLPFEFPNTADAVARSAAEFFEGTSYQWGGITPWGADCSGFVQSLFALHGTALPRDASQQARAGAAADRALADLRAGELAFFSDRDDGAITHVGLGLGGARMAHVAIGRGGFAVERLDAGRDPYLEALRGRFRFARKIF
ncbi:MAG: C40 family peptidase [Gemmatimonadota bacterium]|nr:C40 family peptidase [Gemmatimonadota bacterium]MDE3216129.1 C40 family peptidase [Gemmatimonadota bacterium]